MGIYDMDYINMLDNLVDIVIRYRSGWFRERAGRVRSGELDHKIEAETTLAEGCRSRFRASNIDSDNQQHFLNEVREYANHFYYLSLSPDFEFLDLRDRSPLGLTVDENMDLAQNWVAAAFAILPNVGDDLHLYLQALNIRSGKLSVIAEVEQEKLALRSELEAKKQEIDTLSAHKLQLESSNPMARAFMCVKDEFVSTPDRVLEIINSDHGTIEMTSLRKNEAAVILSALSSHFGLTKRNRKHIAVSIKGKESWKWLGGSGTIASNLSNTVSPGYDEYLSKSKKFLEALTEASKQQKV
ncbi:MAG: hypothetical protein IPI29_04100 [Ignavibacteria bacterium]|nr:hypothetical protein [Ignavibacteria bacterium]